MITDAEQGTEFVMNILCVHILCELLFVCLQLK